MKHNYFDAFQYNDIYNFPQRVFDKAIESVGIDENESESEQEEEREQEIEKEIEMEFEADEQEAEQNGPLYVEADSDDEDDDIFDTEEVSMVNNTINRLRQKITYLLKSIIQDEDSDSGQKEEIDLSDSFVSDASDIEVKIHWFKRGLLLYKFQYKLSISRYIGYNTIYEQESISAESRQKKKSTEEKTKGGN